MGELKMLALNSVPTAPTWVDSVKTELTTTAGDVTTLLVAILGVALGIFALQWGVRKAMKFFKSTTN